MYIIGYKRNADDAFTFGASPKEYSTIKEAETEAARLAGKEPNKVYYILEVIATVEVGLPPTRVLYFTKQSKMDV